MPILIKSRLDQKKAYLVTSVTAVAFPKAKNHNAAADTQELILNSLGGMGSDRTGLKAEQPDLSLRWHLRQSF